MTLYDLLSRNQAYLRTNSQYFLNQAYKTAGLHFQVFDNDTVDVIVPYGDGAAEIEFLRSGSPDRLSHLERLKPYTISLYGYQRKRLEELGGLTATPDGILVLEPSWYDSTVGLMLKNEMTFLEV